MSREAESESIALEGERSPAPSVALSTLVTITLSVVAGAAAALILRNALTGESITFSTTGLVTVLFGVALSAASIVLAISAISLGRSSERAITRRSDESIRIQNEVFAKTIEALARIESSTGVTEKRIEDIISGRAGAISDKITDKILTDHGLEPKTRADIEREIRESIRSEITSSIEPELSEKAIEQKRKVRAERKRYADFKDAVLLATSNLPNVEAIKIGDGKFEGSGSALVDGLFKTTHGSVSISTFGAYANWTLNSGMSQIQLIF